MSGEREITGMNDLAFSIGHMTVRALEESLGQAQVDIVMASRARTGNERESMMQTAFDRMRDRVLEIRDALDGVIRAGINDGDDAAMAATKKAHMQLKVRAEE